MRIGLSAHIAGVVSVGVLAAAVAVRADQVSLSPDHISPDRILKGTAPTIMITLNTSTPDLKEVKGVHVAGWNVPVKAPGDDGKLSVPLPKLDMVGPVDFEVIGKDDKPVASGHLTYIEGQGPPPIPAAAGPSGKELWLLVLYIGLITALPLVAVLRDLGKSYAERKLVLETLLKDTRPGTPSEEIKSLFASMDLGPTGMIGLTRGLLTLMLILAIAFAVFHLIVFVPEKIPEIADKVLMLLAGTLTAITGFYFGSKASSEAAQQPNPAIAAKTPAAVRPKINDFKWEADNRNLSLIGEGFGEHKAKATVKIGDKEVTISGWTDTKIDVVVPAGIQGDVKVLVINEQGASSDLKPTKIP
jgi:hypothetical protein